MKTYLLKLCSVLLGLLLCCSVCVAKPTRITAVKSTLNDKRSQITLHLTDSVRYRYFRLQNPERLVLDIYNTATNPNLKKIPLNASSVKRIRVGIHDFMRQRIVFDLKRAGPTRVQLFYPKGKLGHRLVISLPAMPQKAKPIQSHKPIVAIKTPQAKDAVIVIDPGHGGKDPGAVGGGGTYEKTVVLAVARELAQLINRQTGMRAVLTRHDDRYIGLRKRLAIARKHDADLFVSIHADAYKNRSSHGASVFALSQRGATSEAARWLAEKENYSELGGVNLDGIDDDNGMIRSVLIDLSQTATIGASLELGHEVLKRLDTITSLHNKKVEQARFVVLKSPDIPSVLVEMGFISNPREEKLLKSPQYRRKIAKALLSGIKTYLWQSPPRNSLIAQMKQTRRYKVRRGDNLEKIAKQFSVSVRALKSLNHLSRNTIYIGQRIKIPTTGGA